MDSGKRCQQLEKDLENAREMINHLSGILQTVPKLGGKDDDLHQKLNTLLNNQNEFGERMNQLTEDVKKVPNEVNNSKEMAKVIDTVETTEGYIELFVNDFNRIHADMENMNVALEQNRQINQQEFSQFRAKFEQLEANFQNLADNVTILSGLDAKVDKLDRNIGEIKRLISVNCRIADTGNQEDVRTSQVNPNRLPKPIRNPAHLATLNKLKPMTTILLLGETGVGKSTFINGFVNYLKYGTIEDALEGGVEILIKACFTMFDEHCNQRKLLCEPTIRVEREGCEDNEVTDQGQSATQQPKSYIFSWGPPGNRKSVRIIDTPGICDVRGVLQDKENFQNIMNFIADFKEIHAICILLKPNEEKLTLTFRYCINEVLAHLHVSASKNILFCFTNARQTNYLPGETLRTLQAHLDNLYKEKGIQIELNEKTMFCFDNEAFRFLCALRQGLTFAPGESNAFNSSWVKTVESTFMLFNRISELTPHDVENTLCVYNIRNIMPKLTRSLAEIARNLMVNIKLINDKMRQIDDLIKHGKDLEGRLYVKQEFCQTFDPTVENSIKTNQGKIKTARLFIENMEQKKQSLDKDAKQITESCRTFPAFLKKHSLLPVNDSYIEYVDHLIQEERVNIQPGGSSDFLNQLESLKEEYKLYQMAAYGNEVECDKTTEEIYEMLKKICSGDQEGMILRVRNHPRYRSTVVNLSTGFAAAE